MANPAQTTCPKSITSQIVIREPPEKFVNQQYDAFDVAVKTTLTKKYLAEATLKVELAYADDFSTVPEYCVKRGATKRPPHKINLHKMLQVINHPHPFNANGETSLRVRINDVSRNHGGRKFPDPEDMPGSGPYAMVLNAEDT